MLEAALGVLDEVVCILDDGRVDGVEGVAEDVSSVTLSVVVVFHFMVVESGDDSALEAYVAMSCLEFGV